MVFSQKELQIIKAGKENGFTRAQIEDALKNSRLGITPTSKKSALVFAGQKKGGLGTTKDVAVGVGKGLLEGAIGLGRLATVVPERIGQATIAGLDPNRTFQEVKEQQNITEILGLSGKSAEEIDEQLRAKNEEERLGKILGFAGEVAAGSFGLVRRGVVKGIDVFSNLVRRSGVRIGDEVPTFIPEEPSFLEGVKQTGKELFERIPRFAGRLRQRAEDAAERARLLKESTPEVQNAIKSNLDTRFITTAQEADAPTLKAYREMLDIAEDTKGGTLKPRQQPSIVAGRVVEEQFDLIEKQRKTVGKQIEETIHNLPDAKVNMRPSLNQIDDVLTQNRITITDKGKLQSPVFTKQQLARLQELYDQAISAGDVIDAKLVHGMDRVFSQLQREARFENLDNIFLNVNGQDVNAFRIFRDIFRNQLDNLSPEMRQLNNQYRVLRTTINDMENSIFKSPNFEATKVTDPAEFAKVNLRRLAGEAQSSPAYQTAVEEMDVLARQLGYEGARGDDLIYFAQELRKLYPQTIPPTGFTGGIRTSLRGIVENVLEAGKPDIKDQQEALRGLIEAGLRTAE